MIEITKGNLLEADVEALVNTVNCVGFMGKGIALQFKQAFPENFEAYQKDCKAKKVRPGKMLVYETGEIFNPKYIINFPTKRHWRGSSKIEDIAAGLKMLIEEIKHYKIKSVAVPPLGCGLGGLDWNVVRPMIEKSFEEIPEVKVLLYAPKGAPDAKEMPVRTGRPKLTDARALFLKLMEQYLISAYRLTLLEIQKLAYFLQEAGEPLRLKYEAGLYGPYAHNLNKVLEILEGHFIRGYGDSQKPDVELELLPRAIDEANTYLASNKNSIERLMKVARIIEGFETPYGMELLSSVHWVAIHNETPAKDEESAIAQIYAWNDRKRNMFKPGHIQIAWRRLQGQGWI
jgi:O-acetyl-ADP-ribose deacetylase (regulator of RNase III)